MCLGNDSCRRPQDDLSRALLGPPFHLSYRYAQLLVTYYIVMLYGTGMPLLYPISCVSFVVTYWWVVWVGKGEGSRTRAVRQRSRRAAALCRARRRQSSASLASGDPRGAVFLRLGARRTRSRRRRTGTRWRRPRLAS